MVVRNVSERMTMRVQKSVRKKGMMERRDVRRRNQWVCVSDDEVVEDVSDRLSSSWSRSRDVERGISEGGERER